MAYDSPRNSVFGYEKVALENGWGKLGKILISDQYVESKAKDFTAEVSKDLIEAKNVLVFSHVKGHYCSGFGGAIKNLGMGGVSPQTKEEIHNLSKPKYIATCRGCSVCVEYCPAKAVVLNEGKAVFSEEKCYGCSVCQVNCPYNCLAPKQALFDDLLAQGSAAIIINLPKKTYYINFIKNIARYCDCENTSGGIIAKDVGFCFQKARWQLIKPALI